MTLSQVEAELLLKMPKAFEDAVSTVDFPKVQAFASEYSLQGIGFRALKMGSGRVSSIHAFHAPTI